MKHNCAVYMETNGVREMYIFLNFLMSRPLTTACFSTKQNHDLLYCASGSEITEKTNVNFVRLT